MKNIYLGNNSFANVKIPEYMRQFLSLGKRDSQLCFIVFVNRIIDTDFSYSGGLSKFLSRNMFQLAVPK